MENLSTNNNPMESQDYSQNIWTIVLSIVITATIVGVCFYLWQKTQTGNLYQEIQDLTIQNEELTEEKKSLQDDLAKNKQEVQTNQIVTTKKVSQPVALTTQQSTQANDKIASWRTYRNEKYGFEFLFDEGYKNLWVASETSYSDNNDIIADIDFNINIKDVPGPSIFVIHVFNRNWWLNNAEVDQRKDVWRKGEKKGLGSALGTYLGENEKFSFTLWPNTQSCPDLSLEGPGPICKLTENKVEMVLDSFKTIK